LIEEILFYQGRDFALWSKVVSYKAVFQMQGKASNTNSIQAVNKVYIIAMIMELE
jgi:hypothetical protein